MAEKNISVDKKKLKEVIEGLAGKGESDWCVACGAGAQSALLDFPKDVVDKVGRQFLDTNALPTLVSQIKEIGGEQARCVACGAGAQSVPLQNFSRSDVSDKFINELAKNLISTLK